MTNARAPIADEELKQWAELRADDAGHLARELVKSRAALRDIIAPRECGCSPICQCYTADGLSIHLDVIRDIAESALPILPSN